MKGSDVPVEPEDRFEMANSTQHDGVADDGVGVSPRGNAHHGVRVRFNITTGWSFV
jgi:hypothetical protein